MDGVGLTQRYLLGWEAAAAGAQRLWMDRDDAARKGPLDLNKVCPAPVDGSPFFSYFSIFKRMHHFLDSHDPEAKYNWPSTTPTLMPSILLLPPPPLPASLPQPIWGSPPGLDLHELTPRGQAAPATPSQHHCPLY